MTKEVDIWITETPNDILIDTVGVANLTPEELKVLIDYLRDCLGKKVNEKKNTSSIDTL